ncbi:MAG: hypothetical protein ACKPH4_16605, partial [Microcystis panniformis]
LSFVAPVLLVGSILTALFATSHVPGFTWVSQTVFSQILQFLTIFGDGYPLQGMLTIAVTFAFVGSLFDLFNFYVYQTNRGQ